ncbi:hypothetical protein BCR44DRAFT_54973, partial [Catenaria anguillulae PL171]
MSSNATAASPPSVRAKRPRLSSPPAPTGKTGDSHSDHDNDSYSQGHNDSPPQSPVTNDNAVDEPTQASSVAPVPRKLKPYRLRPDPANQHPSTATASTAVHAQAALLRD